MTAPCPHVVTTVADLRAALRSARRDGKRIGLAPTMGALHEGHLSLVRRAKAECEIAVVSIYVNPSQFGPQEDFARYPRTLQSDLDLLATVGADLVFAPQDGEVYRAGHATWVVPEGAALPLEGESRPGHFRGVATIVLKLLLMSQADRAYFGQKDFQQAQVIRQMAADLDVPTEICVCPIVREADGLAMSSRNRYLSPAARQRALVLSQSLALAEEMVARGERGTAKIRQAVEKVILAAGDARIDYIALVDPHTLAAVDQITGPTAVLLAVWIENTRLIDNTIVGGRGARRADDEPGK